MWVAFNKKGAVIKTLQHGIPARQGVVGTFYIFAYFQDINLSDYGDCRILIKKPSGEFTSSMPMDLIGLQPLTPDDEMDVDELGNPLPPLFKLTDNETPVSALPFVDGERYSGYKFVVGNADVLDMEGTYKATIRLYGKDDLAGTILVEGMLSFYVEPSVMPESYDISPSQFETLLSDLANKQNKLYSNTTEEHTQNLKTINGQDLLGQGNIEIQGGGGGSGTAFESFPDSWPRGNTTTTKEFCDIVNADPDAYVGKAYLGGVSWSDLPFDGNADITVQIMSGTGTSNKVILLTCTSSNVAPYRWQYTYWNDGVPTMQWVGFATQSEVDLKADRATTYTKAETNELLAQKFTYVVTDTLPTASEETMYKIYLVPANIPEQENIKNEFVTIDLGEGGEVRYIWEQIGSTAIDLSNYVTLNTAQTLTANKSVKSSVNQGVYLKTSLNTNEIGVGAYSEGTDAPAGTFLGLGNDANEPYVKIVPIGSTAKSIYFPHRNGTVVLEPTISSDSFAMTATSSNAFETVSAVVSGTALSTTKLYKMIFKYTTQNGNNKYQVFELFPQFANLYQKANYILPLYVGSEYIYVNCAVCMTGAGKVQVVFDTSETFTIYNATITLVE